MTIKAKITQTNNIKASVKHQNEIVAETLKVGGIALADISDIDATGKVDGALLIYNATSEKFELKTDVENENITITAGLY